MRRAWGLRAADIGVLKVSSSDPYAVVSCAGVEAKTRTIKQQLEPKWEETLTLAQPNFDAAVTSGVTVQVFDWDRFTADDLLGTVHVELAVLKTQPHETFVVALDTKGRIFFEVTWLPEAPEASEEAAASVSPPRSRPAKAPVPAGQQSPRSPRTGEVRREL